MVPKVLIEFGQEHGALLKAGVVLIGAALAGAFGAGVSISEFRSSIADKADRQEVSAIAADVSHLKRTVDDLAPLVRQTSIDVAVIKQQLEASEKTDDDHEERLRALEHAPRR